MSEQFHMLKYKKKRRKCKEQTKLAKAFTKVLMAIIFVLISLIYVRFSDINHENYKKAFFETSFSFTSFEAWYEQYFGKVLPTLISSPTAMVSKTSMECDSTTQYENGVSCQGTKGSTVSALNSGILVFLGEKEKYGNVAIIQGIDGVDIWYGNIENIGLNLYDYVEKGTLLGTSKEDNIYLVFLKDGQFLEYEEYKNHI